MKMRGIILETVGLARADLCGRNRSLSLRIVVLLALAGGFAAEALAQPDSIPEIRVTARRLPAAASDPIFATTVIGRDELARSPGLRLDDALRVVPGFSLFRRQSSRSAHPTTQGVTLRGLGASGAGRTLVTLDGVPQNDPFGGWIDWSRLPSAAVGAASVIKGGGAGPWGNAALAGVIALDSRAFAPNSGEIELRGGERGVFEGTFAGAAGIGDARLDGFIHGHSTDGAILVRRDQRGPVDRKAANKGGSGAASLSIEAADLHAWVRGSYSEDRLINGIDAARSRGRIGDLSTGIVSDRGDGGGWEAHAYIRDQDFKAIFVAVNPQRTAATLSLDQFDVPAQAIGGNVVARLVPSASVVVSGGVDVRFADGATNEQFQNLGAGFTRLRKAGGDQRIGGAFAEVSWLPNPDIVVTASARADHWRQYDGLRRETVIATGAVARDDRFAATDGTVGSFRLGGRWQAGDAIAFRAAAYSGFRVPTLNELYRPFRVGNDITEGNPLLTPERLWGVDIAAEIAFSENARAEVAYIRSWLKDSVVNVTLRATPGLDPATGIVVPAGGVLRRRSNVPRATSDAFEADFEVDIASEATLTARYLYADPKITRSPAQPALIGARLAQVPRHQIVFGAIVDVTNEISGQLNLRHVSRQFDDDLNLRVLDRATVLDARLAWRINDRAELLLAAENLFDELIEAGRSADGLVSVGTPRTLTAGLNVNF